MPKTTIYTKLLSLVTSNLLLAGSILLTLLCIVALIIVRNQLNTIEHSSRATLIEKGTILTANNSQALRGLVADHAFSAIRELLDAAVKEDPDVVYGVFMDPARQPWVISGDRFLVTTDSANTPLTDTLSIWADTLGNSSFREIHRTSGTILEVAAPVIVDGERLGTIRYGLSTRRMTATISEQKQILFIASIVLALGIFAVMGATLFIGSLRARQQALAITKPIADLVTAAGRITAGDYGRQVNVQSDDEVGELAQTFETMRITMKNYTENLETMVKDRTAQLNILLTEKEDRLNEINSDLDLAKLVQRSLLPGDLSGFPGLRLAAYYRPNSAVGGDLYDVVAINADKTSLLMFDVSGHGIAAALYGARAMAEFTRCVRLDMSPGAVLLQVHKDLLNIGQDSRYLTAFLGNYDCKTRLFTFSRAGHPPAIVVRHATGTLEKLTARGSLVGMNLGEGVISNFEEKSAILNPGDRLIIITDGITECMSSANEKFGDQRLANALLETRDKPIETVVAEVITRIESFSGTEIFNDDVTMLCAEAL